MRPDRASLIYDGECGFCQQAVDLVRRWDREQRIVLVPFQDQARVAAFGIPLPALAAAMHLVLPPPDGRVLAGVAVPAAGRAARCTAGICLDRATAPLPGARLRGALGSEQEMEGAG